MRRALLAALLSISTGASAQIADQVVRVPGVDSEMNNAIAHAQATLDSFLALAAKPPPGAVDFQVKVKFPHSADTEHIWVAPFRQTDLGFVGTLAGEPRYAKGVVNGQRVAFVRSDISDWGYVQDGKRKGNFTVCVLFKRMPPTEVRQYREQYGFEC